MATDDDDEDDEDDDDDDDDDDEVFNKERALSKESLALTRKSLVKDQSQGQISSLNKAFPC